MDKLSKEKFWDFFILVARVLLAATLIRYGWSKLTDGQFGVSDETLKLPLAKIDLFRLSWYLADHEPFKSFVGVSQMLIAILLFYNRTVILGALMSIPIWLNILMWDMTFMGLYTPLTVRIPFYLLLTFLILWHYRDRVMNAIRLCLNGTFIKFKYPVWAYLLIPLLAICLELLGAIPIIIINLLK